MYCKPITLTPQDITHFESLVQRNGPDECWPWFGGQNNSGYGTIWIAGKDYLAHRVAYTIDKGPLGNLLACHTCDYRLCCNSSHLFPGTHDANKADSVVKQRHAHGDTAGTRTHPERYRIGSARPTAKLTESQAAEIRRLYAEGGHTYRSLAEQFHVGRTTIDTIIKRIYWKHVR